MRSRVDYPRHPIQAKAPRTRDRLRARQMVSFGVVIHG